MKYFKNVQTILPQICMFIWSLQYGEITSDTPIKSSRIIGGQATTISSVKYLVYLRVNGRFSCGGTLVTANYVVTAAHCVEGLSASSLTIVGGASDLNETGTRRQVSKIITPKSYRSNSFNMDVAVLKLSAAMSGPNISTIGLCNSTMKAGNTIKVSGWGITSENGKTPPNRVRTVDIPLISKAQCQRMYRGQSTLTDSMLCAASADGRDACTGDSGGPAIYEGSLCGIVSWGIGCGRSRYPGIYTNVGKVLTFINKALTM